MTLNCPILNNTAQNTHSYAPRVKLSRASVPKAPPVSTSCPRNLISTVTCTIPTQHCLEPALDDVTTILVAMSPPTSRRFVTQLLDSLSSSPTLSVNEVPGANPLSAVPELTKKKLLSLQVLFPNEFLPALDLLDRRLVTRLTIIDGENVAKVSNLQVQNTTLPLGPRDAIYYVRSAQQRPSRYSTSFDTTTCYQVRLRAWNCSCPAFAFAAFPAIHPEPALPTYTTELDLKADTQFLAREDIFGDSWSFGGVSLGVIMSPVCKHLLACVLIERCSGLFGASLVERTVSLGECAGWAAGWGD